MDGRPEALEDLDMGRVLMQGESWDVCRGQGAIDPYNFANLRSLAASA